MLIYSTHRPQIWRPILTFRAFPLLEVWGSSSTSWTQKKWRREGGELLSKKLADFRIPAAGHLADHMRQSSHICICKQFRGKPCFGDLCQLSEPFCRTDPVFSPSDLDPKIFNSRSGSDLDNLCLIKSIFNHPCEKKNYSFLLEKYANAIYWFSFQKYVTT